MLDRSPSRLPLLLAALGGFLVAFLVVCLMRDSGGLDDLVFLVIGALMAFSGADKYYRREVGNAADAAAESAGYGRT